MIRHLEIKHSVLVTLPRCELSVLVEPSGQNLEDLKWFFVLHDQYDARIRVVTCNRTMPMPS